MANSDPASEGQDRPAAPAGGPDPPLTEEQKRLRAQAEALAAAVMADCEDPASDLAEDARVRALSLGTGSLEGARDAMLRLFRMGQPADSVMAVMEMTEVLSDLGHLTNKLDPEDVDFFGTGFLGLFSSPCERYFARYRASADSAIMMIERLDELRQTLEETEEMLLEEERTFGDAYEALVPDIELLTAMDRAIGALIGEPDSAAAHSGAGPAETGPSEAGVKGAGPSGAGSAETGPPEAGVPEAGLSAAGHPKAESPEAVPGDARMARAEFCTQEILLPLRQKLSYLAHLRKTGRNVRPTMRSVGRYAGRLALAAERVGDAAVSLIRAAAGAAKALAGPETGDGDGDSSGLAHAGRNRETASDGSPSPAQAASLRALDKAFQGLRAALDDI
ncbi:MAG: hypothetical protein LBT40_09620 [Deltaproteobacteria bacterium]|nr:hypothetical protein [Deltaproteobacteria bacterium]